MIDTIEIRNFKCFEYINADVRPLTVLSGINGMGKSSFMQALLLLRQSVLGPSGKVKAELNGGLVNLGYPDDVLYESAKGNDDIAFTLTGQSEGDVTFAFRYEKGTRRLPSTTPNPQTSSCSLFGDNFFYLKAERIGPRTSFDAMESETCRLNPIGNAGEYCAHLLAQYERKPIASKSLLHESEFLDELRAQVEAWLSEIGQTPRIHLDEHHAMDLVNLQFSFVRDGIPSSNYRPTNVGFGLTYTLPIFVAALLVKPGGMLLIENPEAHLHPKGQSAMGRFLAKVAASGVQVFVETHSDHLLNGIRIAVKKELISPDDVALHFFYREKGKPSTSVTTPKLDRHGRLDEWPDGFFDEWENGLAELL